MASQAPRELCAQRPASAAVAAADMLAFIINGQQSTVNDRSVSSRGGLGSGHGPSGHVAKPTPKWGGYSSLRGRLEQLDRIAVRILHLNLPAARTGFHPVAKPQSLALELSNPCGQVLHPQDHPVPPPRFLLAAMAPRARARRR